MRREARAALLAAEHRSSDAPSTRLHGAGATPRRLPGRLGGPGSGRFPLLARILSWRAPSVRTSATSRSSPTSTTARRRSSTPCCARPAPSARTSTWKSAPWTRTTSSVRRASRSSPRTRRSRTRASTPPTARSRSTSSTPPVTPTSAARSSAACRWSTASSCSSTRARARCRRRASCCARRSRRSSPSSCWSTRPTARTPASPRSRRRRTTCCSASRATCVDDVPDLDVDALLDVPVVYASGRAGAASRNRPDNGTLPDNDDLEPLFEAILEHVPAPSYDDEAPAAGVGHQPRLEPVPRPPRAAARLQRHPQEGPDGRLGAPRRHASATPASPSC